MGDESRANRAWGLAGLRLGTISYFFFPYVSFHIFRQRSSFSCSSSSGVFVQSRAGQITAVLLRWP